MTFTQGHVIKRDDEDIDYLHLICQGEVGVFQRLPQLPYKVIENNKNNIPYQQRQINTENEVKHG